MERGTFSNSITRVRRIRIIMSDIDRVGGGMVGPQKKAGTSEGGWTKLKVYSRERLENKHKG